MTGWNHREGSISARSAFFVGQNIEVKFYIEGTVGEAGKIFCDTFVRQRLVVRVRSKHQQPVAKKTTQSVRGNENVFNL